MIKTTAFIFVQRMISKKLETNGSWTPKTREITSNENGILTAKIFFIKSFVWLVPSSQDLISIGGKEFTSHRI